MRTATRPATARQIAFVKDLALECGEDVGAFMARHEAEGTFADSRLTSTVIDALIARRRDVRRAAPVADTAAEVEPGYYALEYQGVLRFYRIAEGKGRWEGRTFVNRFRSDDLGRVGRDEAREVRAAIAADPLGTGMRFAAELTRCRVCARMLTDAESRARGIGPDCAGLR